MGPLSDLTSSSPPQPARRWDARPSSPSTEESCATDWLTVAREVAPSSPRSTSVSNSGAAQPNPAPAPRRSGQLQARRRSAYRMKPGPQMRFDAYLEILRRRDATSTRSSRSLTSSPSWHEKHRQEGLKGTWTRSPCNVGLNGADVIPETFIYAGSALLKRLGARAGDVFACTADLAPADPDLVPVPEDVAHALEAAGRRDAFERKPASERRRLLAPLESAARARNSASPHPRAHRLPARRLSRKDARTTAHGAPSRVTLTPIHGTRVKPSAVPQAEPRRDRRTSTRLPKPDGLTRPVRSPIPPGHPNRNGQPGLDGQGVAFVGRRHVGGTKPLQPRHRSPHSRGRKVVQSHT